MVEQDGASTIQATTPTRLHNGQLFGDHKLLPLLLSSPRKNQKLPLVDKRGRLNVEIRGLPKTFLYWGDLFHTLVNMPNSRFIAILFCTYCLLFFGFAIPYYYDAYNNSCIPGVVSFDHAFWFSVQTSMTIGYGGDLTPDPSCLVTNLMVLIQSLASLIIAYSLLGVFYVRFSRPARRAQTLIFSRYMVMHEEDGVPIIAFRIANIRKHQIIEANVRLLVAFNNTLTDEDESMFNFTSLPVIGGSQVFLGLPCTVKHPITTTSPLYGLTLKDLENADMEILVLLEGVDASTSSKLQARVSYRPCEMRKDYRFETMVIRMPSGCRRVDFKKFDSLLPVTSMLVTRPLTPCASAAALPPFPHAATAAAVHGAFEGAKAAAQAKKEEDNEKEDRDKDEGHQWSDLHETMFKASSEDIHSLLTSTTEVPRSLLTGRVSLDNNDSSPQTEQFDHKMNLPIYNKQEVHSLPDLSDGNEGFFLSSTVAEARNQEIEQRLLIAEARAQAWKQMVVELATRVHQTLQQPTNAADANRGPLVACARQALSMAVSSN